MIEIKLSFNSVAEAAAFLAGRTGAADAPLPAIVPPPPPPAPAEVKPGKSKDVSKTETAAAAPAPTPPAASPPSAATAPTAAPAPAAADLSTLPYEKTGIAEKISGKVGREGKRDAVVALLAKFGVKKGPEIKPADFGAFIAELEAL